jgi:hypothetical protein
MDLMAVKIAIGTRFKISELGAVRCPTLAGKVGTVVALGGNNTGITVLFDGARRPTCVHRDYISALREEHRVHKGANGRIQGDSL